MKGVVCFSRLLCLVNFGSSSNTLKKSGLHRLPFEPWHPFEPITLCCFGCLARRSKSDAPPFPWEAALLISSADCQPQLWPLGLCAAEQCWTLWFAHLLPPKCNCNYKGNNPNVGFLHILKPNCYNHQVIVSDASSSLAYRPGLHPSATAFFLRTALVDSAALRAGWSVLFPGVKRGYLGESDLGSHLVILFSLAKRKVVIGDCRASLEQNSV